MVVQAMASLVEGELVGQKVPEEAALTEAVQKRVPQAQHRARALASGLGLDCHACVCRRSPGIRLFLLNRHERHRIGGWYNDKVPSHRHASPCCRQLSSQRHFHHWRDLRQL